MKKLVPSSPWCANAAAWCGLALTGFYALALAARAGDIVCERMAHTRMLQEFATDAAVLPPVEVRTVSVSVSGALTPLLAAAALLAVAPMRSASIAASATRIASAHHAATAAHHGDSGTRERMKRFIFVGFRMSSRGVAGWRPRHAAEKGVIPPRPRAR